MEEPEYTKEQLEDIDKYMKSIGVYPDRKSRRKANKKPKKKVKKL